MYAVAGVSGQTGAATAAALLARGAGVRVIVRRPEAGAIWASRGAEVALADLADTAALTAALRGTQGAFLLSPTDYSAPDPYHDAARVGGSLAQAIVASELPCAVVLSSIGAQHAGGTGIVRTNHLVEQALQRIEAPTVLLRAAFFLENWRDFLPAVIEDGALPSFLIPTDRPFPMVSVRDIGAAAAAILTGPGWTGRRVVELAGPAEYRPQDVAEAFGALLQRPVDAFAIVPEDWRRSLSQSGMGAVFVEGFAGLYEGVLAGRVAAEPGNERMRGVQHLADVLADICGARVTRTPSGESVAH